MNSVAISLDNKFIVSGSEDITIRVWERESGSQLQEIKGHKNSITCVIISSDIKLIVSGSFDNSVRIWELESG